MSSTLPLPQRLARALLRPVSALSDRLGNHFYVGLAVLVIIAAAFAITTGLTGGMKSKAYDLIMKYRLYAPAPDPDIVVLDIDEPALAAMASEYGRWPWPRAVMGELVDGVAAQQPQALVFDIAFSDPDVFNVDADRYFRDAVARNTNSYFPMIRLVEDNDARSALRLSQLPGVVPLEQGASVDATIAMVLPYFADVLTGARMGTNNILSDVDGMVRTYPVYAYEYGWRVNSLPANVVSSLGIALPDKNEILLNWRGRPLSYRHVSFHEVYLDLLKKERTRPVAEFKDKIVIIGSTAPGLFDFKPTSVSKAHPGVEILATALDNLKNGDSLRELPRWVYVLVTALSVLLLATAFVYNVDQRLITLTFTVLQTGFLVVSYLCLNVSTWFVDLTAPFAFCLAYFTIARVHGTFSSYRRSGHPLFSTVLDEGGKFRVIFVECRLHLREHNARLRLGAQLKKLAGRTRFGVVAPPLFKGVPLLHAFLHDSLIIYWSVPIEKENDALDDVLTLLERMLAIIERAASRKRSHGVSATLVLHTVAIEVDAAGDWRDTGQQALAELMQVADAGDKKQVVRILATPDVTRWCRALKKPIAPVLVQAGLGSKKSRS